jgi:hypothetical protein
MDISLINSQSLLHLLSLTEKKEEILQILGRIDAEILRTLKGGVSVEVVEIESVPAPAVPAQKPVAALKAPAKPAKAKKAKAGKPGGLKERILALLETAGSEGLKVREIAEKLAAKPANISVWFSTTGKKLVTKVEPGRYAVKGAKKSAARPAAVAPAAKASKKTKTKKRKSGLTPEGRAKLAANMKARWAARKAGKPAAKVGKPAKKGFKLPKKA